MEPMSKSRSRENAAKGRRYSLKEREEVLAFIEKVNAERGRGGQSAAIAKFNLAPLTVTKWVRYHGFSASKSDSITSDRSIESTIQKLKELQTRIENAEKELRRLRNQFQEMKGAL